MASSYNISDGSTQFKLDIQPGQDIAGVVVVSDSALNAAITLKLRQSADGLKFNDMPETPILADTGENSNLLQTNSFVSGDLYLDIDVLTATLGTLSLVSFGR